MDHSAALRAHHPRGVLHANGREPPQRRGGGPARLQSLPDLKRRNYSGRIQIPMKFLAESFQAMGSPCEILLDTLDTAIMAEQRDAALQEALRIEKKFS